MFGRWLCFVESAVLSAVGYNFRFHAQYPYVAFNVRMSSTDEAVEAVISLGSGLN